MSLITHLKQIPNFRTQSRCPLWVILLWVIMATMSGCQGYRALEEFVQPHQRVLIELLELPCKRLSSSLFPSSCSRRLQSSLRTLSNEIPTQPMRQTCGR